MAHVTQQSCSGSLPREAETQAHMHVQPDLHEPRQEAPQHLSAGEWTWRPGRPSRDTEVLGHMEESHNLYGVRTARHKLYDFIYINRSVNWYLVTTSASGVPGPRAGLGAAKDHATVRTQGPGSPGQYSVSTMSQPN